MLFGRGNDREPRSARKHRARSSTTVKQATTTVQSHEPPRHEPMLEVGRILMVDLAATRGLAKGAAPSTNRGGGQTKASVAKALNALPPLSADGVDRLYHQLVEIDTIVVAQVAECIHWRWSNPTTSLVHARASWQRPTAEPSMARLTPHPPTDFSHQATLWQRGKRVEPQAHRQACQGAWACNPSTTCITCTTTNKATRRNTIVTSRGQGRRGSKVACVTCSNRRPSRH
jgi:hypothetical protein